MSFSHRSLRTAAALALACAAVAGCGSSSKTTSSGTTASQAGTTPATSTQTGTSTQAGTTATTATAPTTTGTTSASGSSTTSTTAATGLAGKSPDQIVQAAAAAISSVDSFRMTGDITSGNKHQAFAMQVHSKQSFAMTLSLAGGTAQLKYTGGKSYIEGNRAFWVSEADAATAAKVAGKWIIVPNSTLNGLTDSLGSIAPSQLGYCLAHGPHGKFSIAGNTTVNGQSAILLRDDGNAPDDQPGTLAVASTGTPFPLQLKVTGTERPGPKTKCDDGTGGKNDGTVTLSDFGQVPQIAPPSNPLDLSSSSQT